MAKLMMIKTIKETHLFQENQRCWIVFRAGDGSVNVVGKHRGKHRYVKAWLHDGEYGAPKEIEVSEEFYQKIMGSNIIQS
jgi:hypothetical protein